MGRLRRGRRERGSVLVEAAFVFPVLFLLILGALDYGLLFRDDLTVTNMSRNGARSGSAVGNATSPSADYTILKSIVSSASALQSGLGAVTSVAIFNANCGVSGNPACNSTSDPASSAPSSCTGTTGVTGVCNVYVNSDLTTLATTSFGCTTGKKDIYWCPSTRVVSQSGNGGKGPDYLGVYITSTHRWLTGFFGTTKVIHDTVVFRLEPQTL